MTNYWLICCAVKQNIIGRMTSTDLEWLIWHGQAVSVVRANAYTEYKLRFDSAAKSASETCVVFVTGFWSGVGVVMLW